MGGLVGAAIVAGSIYWWMHRDHDQQSGSERTETAQQGEDVRGRTRVKVVKPRQGGLTRSTTQPGTLHYFEMADLYAKAAGFLRAQVVDIGDTVERGQTLAEVFDPEREEDVERAAARVEQAKAEVAQAEALVTVAKAQVRAERADVKEKEAEVAQYTATRKYREKQYVRYVELAVSRVVDERTADERQQDFESAKAGEDVAHAAVESAEGRLAKAVAGVVKAEADLKSARAALGVAEVGLRQTTTLAEYLRLTSPYTGVVTARNYHRGDFIKDASERDTMPVLTVARTDLMRVVVYIPDRDIPDLDRGDEAVVRLDALPGEQFQGEVARFSNAELSTNRTMRCEIDLPNPTGRLRDGMYGNVTILLEKAPDVLTVPSGALHQADAHGQGKLYVVQGGKAVEKTVRVGRDDGMVAEVPEGLGPDDRVVISYSGALADGDPVVATSATGD